MATPLSLTGSTPDAARRTVLSRRIQLFVAATITYNVIEAVVAKTAGTMASSTALIGFRVGLDNRGVVRDGGGLAVRGEGPGNS